MLIIYDIFNKLYAVKIFKSKAKLFKIRIIF